MPVFLQKTKEDQETLEKVREWVDTHQCVPKALCGDMAFHTPSFTEYYRVHSIHPLPTGANTPWPNRAEAAVRLFKRQFKLLLVEVDQTPSLASCTLRSVIRKAVMARNSALTYGGKSPIELVTGRRPIDIIDIENADPQQLSAPLFLRPRKFAFPWVSFRVAF